MTLLPDGTSWRSSRRIRLVKHILRLTRKGCLLVHKHAGGPQPSPTTLCTHTATDGATRANARTSPIRACISQGTAAESPPEPPGPPACVRPSASTARSLGADWAAAGRQQKNNGTGKLKRAGRPVLGRETAAESPQKQPRTLEKEVALAAIELGRGSRSASFASCELKIERGSPSCLSAAAAVQLLLPFATTQR